MWASYMSSYTFKQVRKSRQSVNKSGANFQFFFNQQMRFFYFRVSVQLTLHMFRPRYVGLIEQKYENKRVHLLVKKTEN
jgi:hypothetical protein